MAPGILYGQFDFKLAGRDVQVHSFASQGFAYSNHNNYLSMHTSDGSFSMIDGGINISTQLTDKFRVGAQFYDRKVGKLGTPDRPEFDWYVADYRFTDWFGVRGGRVKTAMGLFNDTQDLMFLHTWALLPQSVYPVDSRGDNISHVGGDIYGNIHIKKFGGLSYTFYGGYRPNDPGAGLVYGNETSSNRPAPNGGVIFYLSNAKTDLSFAGPVFGADLRWTTALNGLVLGTSFMNLDITGHGRYRENNAPYINVTPVDKTYAFYTQYTRGKFTFNGEYRRQARNSLFTTQSGGYNNNNRNARQGYVSASYRLSKWLEVGAYHSRMVTNWERNHGDPQNHVFDTTLSSKFDLTKYLDLKFEGHFIDGNMVNSGMSRGFFVAENVNGFAPQMKMLVIRLDYHM